MTFFSSNHQNRMAFTDFVAGLVHYATAEEPVEDDVVESVSDESSEAGEDAEEEEEEEDEDDEEESEDQFDLLKKQCEALPTVAPLKHHYHECVERVTKEMEEDGYADKDYKEDCVEEFFHLQHALTDCAAPKLFDLLK